MILEDLHKRLEQALEPLGTIDLTCDSRDTTAFRWSCEIYRHGEFGQGWAQTAAEAIEEALNDLELEREAA